jgi:hypothetical protein
LFAWNDSNSAEITTNLVLQPCAYSDLRDDFIYDFITTIHKFKPARNPNMRMDSDDEEVTEDELVEIAIGIGFEKELVKKALILTKNDIEAAIDILTTNPEKLIGV